MRRTEIGEIRGRNITRKMVDGPLAGEVDIQAQSNVRPLHVESQGVTFRWVGDQNRALFRLKNIGNRIGKSIRMSRQEKT
jgi:hypothetical protein